MQVRRPVSLSGLRLCGVLFALAAVLPAAGLPAAAVPAAAASSAVLVRHAGTEPVTVDTTELIGTALRAWWIDAVTGTTVDAGSVERGPAVTLFPPDTGDGAAHDWTVVITVTGGLLPPA
jgi:hypothetical protein